MKSKLFVISLVVIVLALGVYYYLGQNNEIKNVILISMDTTRWDALSCYKGPATKTPVIDGFAKEAVLFENAISPIPYTLPSHSSMFTGKIPPAHKVLDNSYYVLGDDQVTLAEKLKADGFTTAAFVSAFVLDSQFGLDQGFDYYDDDLGDKKNYLGITERRGDETTLNAIKWLDEHQDERNFVFIHYYDPHMDYTPPESFASRYKRLFPNLTNEMQAYAGEVGFVDYCIGQVIDKLKDLDMYDNSLICITADHGDSHGEHKEVSHGYYMYNSTTQVPLMFKIPGRAGSIKIKEHVGIVDIAPTICSMLGIPVTETVQGKDIGAYLIADADPYPDRSIFSQANDAIKYEGNSLLGIISKNYKYIQTTRPELYDLAKDENELDNIAASQPHRARMMRDMLKHVLDDAVVQGEYDRVEMDTETIARLESLGYTGSSKGMEGVFDFDQTKEDPKDLIDYHLMTNEVKILIRNKEYEKAKAACKKYISMRPDFYMGYSAMAKVLEEMGDYSGSINFLKRVAELDPSSEIVYFDLASIYEKAGDFDGVMRSAIKSLEIKSDDLGAYYYLAISNFERGDYELPEEYLTEGMKDSELYPKMIVTLADKLFGKKQFKRAYDLYRQSFELGNDSEYILNILGWMSATSSVEGVYDPKAAVRYSLQLRELYSEEKPECLDTLAAAYAANGEFDKAVTTAEKAIALAAQDNNRGLVQRIQSRLQLYRSGKVFYDPGLR
jgi:arylsulfatase A-like enzyme/Flp pilus assembly protein TadD